MKLSIIIGGRNDDYGGKEFSGASHESFINYHAHYFKMYCLDYEVIVVDYNPVQERKGYKNAHSWNKFRNLNYTVVTNEEHLYLTKRSNYPFYGNIAVNRGATKAQGKYILPLSVNSYLSPTLIRYLATNELNSDYFYRSDLIYFSQKYFSVPYMQSIWNKNRTVKNARRHSSSKSKNKVENSNLNPEINFFNRLSRKKYISTINWNEVEDMDLYTTAFWPDFPSKPANLTGWITDSGLHTNASGDFILVSKKAFRDVGGFSEDPNWNLHNDSLFLMQLVKKGYKQKIFKYPHVVFHANHQRGGWHGMPQVSYDDWCKLTVDKLNGP